MRYLGLSIPPAVQQAHAKAILVAWNAQHQVVADYGVADVANPAWTERDGRVLHAFAQWWTGTPQLNPSADQADAFGVVVAQPTPLHVAALDNWFASQGQQVPGVQAADIAASKALLVLWSKTDGTAPSNYGLDPSEFAPAWTTRDTAELALFQAWWNAQGKPAVGTNGALDVASSNALKAWFAERAAAAPSGWVAPAAQPQNAPATPACPPGKLWDEVNQACQPLPAGVSVPGEPPAKSNAVWWVLGGLAAVAVGAVVLSSRSVGAAMAPVQDNPASPQITRRALNKLSDQLGFEWIVARSDYYWLNYGRRHPSTLSARVHPGANEGMIVEVVVTPGPELTPYMKQTVAGRPILVLQGKTFRSQKEAWEQAGALIKALVKRRGDYSVSYDNPTGYYVRVRGGNNETYGPYPTLQRAKTFARIGATKGAHDRVVLKGGKVVRHYRAGTGESLVHENRS
jgi:hypothetical protein